MIPSTAPARAIAPEPPIRLKRQASGSTYLNNVQDQGPAGVGYNNVHAGRPVCLRAISLHKLDPASPALVFRVVAGWIAIRPNCHASAAIHNREADFNQINAFFRHWQKMIALAEHQCADRLDAAADDPFLILFTGGEQMAIEIG